MKKKLRLLLISFLLVVVIEFILPVNLVESNPKKANPFIHLLIQSSIILDEKKEEAQQRQMKIWQKNRADRWNISINYAEKKEIYEDYVYPLAKIIYAEAGNMNDEHQRYVGYVVLNRVESKYYPNSITDVFFQGNAYAETSRVRYKNEEVTDKCIENSKIVINQYFDGIMPVNPAMTFQAEFKQGIVYKKMYNTYFGLDPRILKDNNSEKK